MKPKTMVLMGVAIACGLGASYMTSRLLAERGADDAPKVAVLVAKKTLSTGDTIKNVDELFITKAFAPSDVPPGAITDPEQIRNRILKKSLRSGDHVTPEDMFGETGSEGLPVRLPAGYRAYGVRVSLDTTAAGFAPLPLSRVDLISTVRRGDDSATYAQVLLENVLVLAADTNTDRDVTGKAMPAQVVTLALTPQEALKLSLAQELGTMKLMLRKLGENTKIGHARVTASELKTGESGKDDAEVQVGSHKEGDPPLPVKNDKTKPKTDKTTKPEAPEATEVVNNGKSFTLTIIEGDKTRRTQYQVNEKNEVIEAEVSRSELTPPRVQPKRGEPTPPTTPDDDDN